MAIEAKCIGVAPTLYGFAQMLFRTNCIECSFQRLGEGEPCLKPIRSILNCVFVFDDRSSVILLLEVFITSADWVTAACNG